MQLSELLNQIVDTTEGQPHVTIGELLDSLDSRSHGPMLLLPAALAISPIGMLPGMSLVTATLIILVAVQMMVFSSRPWIPQKIARVQFAREKFRKSAKRAQKWVQSIDRFTFNRLQFLTTGIAIYPVAILCILLALSFYPLAFIPFGVLLPGCAVLLLALGLTVRDGAVIISGFVLTAGTAAALWYASPVGA